MMGFKEFSLNENRGYPAWVKGTTILLTSQVRAMSLKIESETDVGKKIDLLARQNNLISYMLTLGISVNTKDTALMAAVRKRSRS